MNIIPQQPIIQVQINHPPQIVPDAKPDLPQLLSWREEAMVGSSEWRAESWHSCEMYDGDQISEADKAKGEAAGILNMITINRVFPTANLILGAQILNQYDIIAKGRTKKDGEIGEVMTEGIKYVMDQWDGSFKVSQAFRDEVIPGVGFLSPGYSNDPRKERVKLSYRDWKEIWWDPYSSPWIDPETCRYVFHQRWMDIADLQALFPRYRDDIKESFDEFSSGSLRSSTVMDEATRVEEQKQSSIGTGWAMTARKRIRPCEMWYTAYETCLFAMFPDGNVLEVKPDMPPMEQFAMIRAAAEVATATVKKIRVATFLGNLLFADLPSPYQHEMYPFVPFVGYLDRYNQPYGVPKQISGQQEEVNRRRNMALALLNSRRIVMEEDAAGDIMTPQQLYEEANKPDGFLIVKPGAINQQKILIVDQAKLAPEQVALLHESEMEIDEISGVNREMRGSKSNVVSNVALQNRQASSGTVTASLFENLRRSMDILGTQTSSLIKGAWTGEKVLRVTDRLSGADRFVELNKRVMDGTGAITVQNNITQGKVDIVISKAPMNDTTRDLNMQMIIEYVKKAPPEIIPQLLTLAFEMSDIPNKDQLLARLKPLMGQDPREEEMSPTQIRQKVAEQIDAKAQKAAIVEQLQLEAAKLDVQQTALENKKLEAEIQRLMNTPLVDAEKLKIAHRKIDTSDERIRLDGMRTGIQAEEHRREQDMEEVKTAMEVHNAAVTANQPRGIANGLNGRGPV